MTDVVEYHWHIPRVGAPTRAAPPGALEEAMSTISTPRPQLLIGAGELPYCDQNAVHVVKGHPK